MTGYRGYASRSLMELKNKRVLVVGLGKCGIAAAMFLRGRGRG